MSDSERVESDNWCQSSLGYQARTKFDWVIEDFRWRPEKVSKVISSGIFSVSGPDNQVTEWCLQIYPEGRREDEKRGWDGLTIESPENISKKGEHSYFVSRREDTKDHVARARARTWYLCKQASHPMWWVVRRKRSASQELLRRSVPFSLQTVTRKLYGEMQIYLPVCCQIAYFIVKLKERKSKKLLLVMWQLSGGKKK